MMIFDDIEPTNKLVIHDYTAISPRAEGRAQALTDYRLGDSTMPKYESIEPLACAVNDFYQCVKTGQRPVADAASATRVIRVLELAERSLKENGSLIALQ